MTNQWRRLAEYEPDPPKFDAKTVRGNSTLFSGLIAFFCLFHVSVRLNETWVDNHRPGIPPTDRRAGCFTEECGTWNAETMFSDRTRGKKWWKDTRKVQECKAGWEKGVAREWRGGEKGREKSSGEGFLLSPWNENIPNLLSGIQNVSKQWESRNSDELQLEWGTKRHLWEEKPTNEHVNSYFWPFPSIKSHLFLRTFQFIHITIRDVTIFPP